MIGESAMSRGLTPRQIADKQVKRAAASTQDFKDGVNAVTESPMEKAANKADKYLAGVQASVQDGTYQEGLRSVPLEEWKRLTAEKGASRFAEGVRLSADKILEFQTQFQPVRDQVKREVDAMPNDTFEQRMARMVANAEGLRRFKFRRTRARR
jgi:hypothetical protein